MWGALTAALSRLFASKLGRWVAGALAFFGLTIATQQLVTVPSLAYFQSLMSDTGSDVTAWMGFLQFDKAITMLLSAYAARATVSAGKAFLARSAGGAA